MLSEVFVLILSLLSVFYFASLLDRGRVPRSSARFNCRHDPKVERIADLSRPFVCRNCGCELVCLSSLLHALSALVSFTILSVHVCACGIHSVRACRSRFERRQEREKRTVISRMCRLVDARTFLGTIVFFSSPPVSPLDAPLGPPFAASVCFHSSFFLRSRHQRIIFFVICICLLDFFYHEKKGFFIYFIFLSHVTWRDARATVLETPSETHWRANWQLRTQLGRCLPMQIAATDAPALQRP